MVDDRERMFKGSPWRQGENEARPYSWDAATWGFTALDPAVVALKDVTDPEDVTTYRFTEPDEWGVCF